MNIKDKIAIMQAFDSGMAVEFSHLLRNEWGDCKSPTWDWVHFEYRIKATPTNWEIVKAIASVPSTTVDKDKIKGSIKEISDCLTRKQSETDLINDIAEGLKDEFNLSKRLANSLAKTYLEGNLNLS